MRSLHNYFKNQKIDYQKLLEYGFQKQKNSYIYEKFINNNKFKVFIEINNKELYSKVIDVSLNEEYILVDVNNCKGKFIGQIKEEYDQILNDIAKHCTISSSVNQTQEVKEYIKNKYNDNLEYLWEKNPNDGIWRNKDNKKWYGVLMKITAEKIGLKKNQLISIIDLKQPKEIVPKIIDNKTIFPGYHMNKKSWITVKLDGSLNIKEIYKLIDISFNCIKNNIK